jgi:GMP reductase
MKALKYSDISLIPEFGQASSRSDCDTSTEIGGKRYNLPVIPANMKSVVSEKYCEWMAINDYFYIMHRFDIDIFEFILKANDLKWPLISISVGVKDEDRALIEKIAEWGVPRVDFITVDIAHGYSQRMQEMLCFIRERLGKKAHIIAGNVCTPDAVVALYNWGADYVKVGIGQGSPCTTKDKTGFTMPMFSCVKKCSQCYASRSDFNEGVRVPIIADGGVTSNGDIAKAMAAGADLVMAGGLFAACSDSPSVPMDCEGAIRKAYFGSASFENKRSHSHIEGTIRNIPSNGINLKRKMVEITEDLQSAISYGGGKDLDCLKDVKYMEL